jgi:hypothetical protein
VEEGSDGVWIGLHLLFQAPDGFPIVSPSIVDEELHGMEPLLVGYWGSASKQLLQVVDFPSGFDFSKPGSVICRRWESWHGCFGVRARGWFNRSGLAIY